MTKTRKILGIVLAVMILTLAMSISVFADSPVAKVGNVEYNTIDEAVANWTNNTTLTLLSDVTLPDVVTLKSTEHHILNLGTYTLTAADGKNAFEILACGTGAAEQYAITINADATNPGGINAGSKAVVYYNYANGGITADDRPIIKINGGVFNGSTAAWGTAGIYFKGGSKARQAATLNVSGGTFNCTINGQSKSKLIITGGTFNYSVGSQGDSTANRLISGGKFKTLGFMTADSNNTKFWFGTSMGNSNVGLYIDANNYLVVGGPVITELSEKYVAVASNATKWSSYLAYSSAATYGLYYEDADMAIAKHGEANVTVYKKPAVSIPDDVVAESEEAKAVVEEIKSNTALNDYVPENVPAGAELVIELVRVEDKIVYEVAPMAGDVKVEELAEAITFRLPVPASVTEAYAKVYHDGELMGYYEIKGEGDAKYVEISSADFSEFAVEPTEETPVAEINGVGYATFAEALNAASKLTGDVVVEILDKVTLNTSLSGSYDSITFVGKDTDAEIYLDVQGYITATGKKVAFEDLILSKVYGEYMTNAGFMNVAFGVYDVTEVTYTNCTFANGAYASSGKVTFTGCTFHRSHEKYGLWAYGNVDVTVDGCTFAIDRGIKMYAEGAAKTVELTVKDTDFSAVTAKPAIVLTYGASVELEGNTYSSAGVFELDKDGAPNGTTITADIKDIACMNDNYTDCGVIVDGKIYVTVTDAVNAGTITEESTVTLMYNSTETVELPKGVTLDKNGYTATGVTVKKGLDGTGTAEDPYLINNLEDLIWFRDHVNTCAQDGSSQYNGKFVKLTADIDLAGINWTPIGSTTKDHGSFYGTFDGDGHTIYNLYVEMTGTGAGFFAKTSGGGDGPKATIKNITFNNVNVSSDGSYVGGVIANAGGNTEVSNVKVTGDVKVSGYGYVGGIVGHGYPDMYNCSVEANDGSYVRGGYWCVGGIVGYAGEGGTIIKDCSVKNIDVHSVYGGAAAIAGLLQDGNNVENVTAENVEITSNSDYCMGYIAGNGEASTLTNVTVKDVTATANGKPITVTDAVASVNDELYFSLEEAFAAADEGDTIVLLADATPALKSQRAITKASVIDLNGKTLTLTEDDLYFGTTTFKNGTIVVDPSVKPSTAVFWMFANQTLTFDAVKLVATGVTGTYLIGLDGNNADLNIVNGSEIIADNETALDLDIICVNSSTGNDIVVHNSKVTVNNLDGRVFFRGNYTISGASEINLSGITKAGFRIEAGQTLSIEDTSVVTITGEPRDGGIHVTDATATYTKADTATVTATVNVPVEYVAQIGDVKYETLADAFAAIGAGDVVIELLKDATLDYNAREAYGLAGTTSVTINGNGHVLTLNQKDSDWSSIGLANADAKLVLKNMTIEKTGYGDTSGAWNTHAIIFKCNVEMNNVTVNNSVAVQNGATLNNVIINEANEFYGLWINANGQSVTMNGGEINATNGGRGIKIADQYVGDAVASVTLNITDTVFNTAKKAAVLVTSPKGANITASNLDITNVKADSVNAIWVDEDTAANYGKVEVTGATVAQESIEEFVASVIVNGKVEGYYKTLAEALAALKAGDTLTLLADAEINTSIVVTSDLTIDGNGHKITVTGAYGIDIQAAGVDLVINNLTIKSNLYALNMRGVSDNSTVEINDSNLTGCIALNVWGENVVITANNSNFTSVDNATHENYAAVVLNNNGSVSAEGTVITINGGSITALDENGKPSIAVRNATATGKTNISNETVVTGEIKDIVAIVTYSGQDPFYSYFTLQEAIDRAANDATATVKLLCDITVNEALVINGKVVIDLNGKKVTSTAKKAFEVYADATIKNGTIVGANRCVDTRTAVKLTLEDLALVAENYTSTYGNPQPLTIGGSVNGTKVTMSNVNINAGKSGYGIISFVETDLTAADCTITGYAALYVKAGSEGSEFTFEGCTLTGDNTNNDVEGNSFAAIALQANDITVTVDKDSTINAKGNNMYAIAVGSTSIDVTGNTVTVSGTINGNIIATDDFENTVKVKSEYADELVNAGYSASEADENGLVTVEKDEIPTLTKAETALLLEENFKMSFYFPVDQFVDGVNYFAMITKHHVGTCGDPDEITYVAIDMTKIYDADYYGASYRVVADDIAAKEMNCEISCQVFAGEMPENVNDENTAVSIGTVKDSIYEYAMWQLENSNDEKLKTLIVDVLNYGAAAQKYFNHYETVLANRGLTDEQKGSSVLPEGYVYQNVTKMYGPHATEYVGVSSALILEASVHMIFDLVDMDNLVDPTVVVEFTHNGESAKQHHVVYRIDDEEHPLIIDANGVARIIVDDLAAVDAQVTVHCSVYDGEATAKNLLYTVDDSVESYCGWGASTSDAELAAVCERIIKYSQSAKAYFNK